MNAGTVRFQQAPKDRGTFVRVTMNYNPPTGSANIVELLGMSPAQLIKDDLRRLKQVLEAGEIATVEGQTSGRHTSGEIDESSPLQDLANRIGQAKGVTV